MSSHLADSLHFRKTLSWAALFQASEDQHYPVPDICSGDNDPFKHGLEILGLMQELICLLSSRAKEAGVSSADDTGTVSSDRTKQLVSLVSDSV